MAQLLARAIAFTSLFSFAQADTLLAVNPDPQCLYPATFGGTGGEAYASGFVVGANPLSVTSASTQLQPKSLSSFVNFEGCIHDGAGGPPGSTLGCQQFSFLSTILPGSAVVTITFPSAIKLNAGGTYYFSVRQSSLVGGAAICVLTPTAPNIAVQNGATYVTDIGGSTAYLLQLNPSSFWMPATPPSPGVYMISFTVAGTVLPPDPTPSPTSTGTPGAATPTATVSVSPTSTLTATPSPAAPSASSSPSVTPTTTPSPTSTLSAGASPSSTPSPTGSDSVTPSPSPTSSPTGSNSGSPSYSPTGTPSPTGSPSGTGTPSPTGSNTPSSSPSGSVAGTPSVSATSTWSASYSPSAAPSNSTSGDKSAQGLAGEKVSGGQSFGIALLTILAVGGLLYLVRSRVLRARNRSLMGPQVVDVTGSVRPGGSPGGNGASMSKRISRILAPSPYSGPYRYSVARPSAGLPQPMSALPPPVTAPLPPTMAGPYGVPQQTQALFAARATASAGPGYRPGSSV